MSTTRIAAWKTAWLITKTKSSMLILTIAGISFLVDVKETHKIESLTRISGPTGGYEKFFVSDRGEVYIHFTFSDLEAPSHNTYRYRFHSSGLWDLYYNSRHDFRVDLKRAPDGVSLALIDINLDHSSGKIFYTEDGVRYLENRFLPFVYPVDEVIFVNLLPSCNGILVHACGIDDHGEGYLYLGTSGAGKSTTGRLWSDEAGVKILSDDRIVVREIGGTLFAFGTPWHGEANLCDPGGVAIEKIFFLEHAEKNYTRHLSAPEAATMIFLHSFPTFWDREGIGYTLSLIDKTVKNIPCYGMGFVPDKSAVSYVKGLV